MLAGQGSAQAQHLLKKKLLGGIGLAHLLGNILVEHDIHMNIAVSGVAEGEDDDPKLPA